MGWHNKGSPFDPFDPAHAHPRKRRSRQEVDFAAAQWEERVLNHFVRAIAALGEPEWLSSQWLWNEIVSDPDTNLSLNALRLLLQKSMQKLGWKVVKNPRSKDGRFTAFSECFYVFARVECVTTRDDGSGKPLPKNDVYQKLGIL